MRTIDASCCLKWSRRVGVCFICVVLMSPKVFSLFILFVGTEHASNSTASSFLSGDLRAKRRGMRAGQGGILSQR